MIPHLRSQSPQNGAFIPTKGERRYRAPRRCLNPLKTGPSSRLNPSRPEMEVCLCLNPLKTGPSSRHGDSPQGWTVAPGLNPLKTGPSSRQRSWKTIRFEKFSLNPLKTGPSSRHNSDVGGNPTHLSQSPQNGAFIPTWVCKHFFDCTEKSQSPQNGAFIPT